MAVTINGTTGISGVDGSASTPAVQGTDTNTGVFFGTDTVTIATGGTAAVTVDSGQRTKFPTTIGVGNATPSTSGSGITFPATQSASTNANTLDDYEEGDWTPTDASGAGLTLTVNGAQYVKIGRMVYGWLWITYPSTANGNYAEVGGLPFAVAGGNTNGGAFVGYTTYATAGFSGYLIYTTTKISFAIPNGAPSNANLSGKEMRMQFFYVV